LAAVQRLGAKSVRLEVDRPASATEIAHAEEVMGTTIPNEFKQILLGFSRKVEFHWFLRETHAPGELSHIFCGVCAWDIDQLTAMNGEVQWLAENAFADDEPDYQIWHNKFPFQSIGNGDFIAINTAAGEEASIVYLSHEVCYSHGYRLGNSLLDFMDRWTRIGCPSDDIWPLLMSSGEGPIDHNNPNVRAWCEWLGLEGNDT
jgi:hypothetical protein